MQPEPWEPSPTTPERPRYRPPIGIPARDRAAGWRGAIASVAVHLLIVFLLTAPWTVPATIELLEQGAGGPGPVGGGGGGTGGTGGLEVKEGLRFVQIAPPAPAAQAPAVVPTPVPPKPEEKKPEEPKPVPPPVQPQAQPPAAAAPDAGQAAAPVAGTGGGTGSDGTAGSGPGTGGGVGSGVGTGRGSGVGPGTGGGIGDVYPPTPTEVFIAPIPIPGKVKGARIIAQYEVDERGKVLKCDFTPTRDGGYNRKLKDVLCSFRFRPAVRPDGTPVRGIAQVTFEL